MPASLAKEAGKALGTLGQTVNACLMSLRMFVWGMDKIEAYLMEVLPEKLKNVPQEHLITPSLHVAGPALEAMRFTSHEPSLRELYANLLATAMNKETSNKAHPAFVEIIRQLTPDEARIMKIFTIWSVYPLISIESGRPEDLINQSILAESVTELRHFSLLGEKANCVDLDATPAYLDNLCRLGLTEIEKAELTKPRVYDPLEKHPRVLNMLAMISRRNRVVDITRKSICTTDLGERFCKACVVEHD